MNSDQAAASTTDISGREHTLAAGRLLHWPHAAQQQRFFPFFYKDLLLTMLTCTNYHTYPLRKRPHLRFIVISKLFITLRKRPHLRFIFISKLFITHTYSGRRHTWFIIISKLFITHTHYRYNLLQAVYYCV